MFNGNKGLPYLDPTQDYLTALPDTQAYLQALATAVDARVPQIGKLYVPTQETIVSTTYALATTPDRIQNVVMPTDGLFAIGFIGMWKVSAAATVNACVHLGANPVKAPNTASGGSPINAEAQASPGLATGYTWVTTSKFGMAGTMAAGADASTVSTGMTLWNQAFGDGGLVQVFAAAGTYDISVQWKTSTGTLSIKERRLWVHAIPYL